MVIVGLFVTLLLCVAADFGVRLTLEKAREKQLHKLRAEALATSLQLNVAKDVTSLKRVEIPEAKARILAVDDEPIILDSLRKILVLDGYAVDTVESGPEALALLGKFEYDFVFTDLRMPIMDGVEVTKSVKHLRPDIDVVVITAYASIESAIETMKYGAMDYLQKPFTEDELVQFVAKAVIRRHHRIEQALRPRIHLITPAAHPSADAHGFNVASGVFVSAGHTWASIRPNGALFVGLDDFAQRLLGPADKLILPQVGQTIQRGETLFSLHCGSLVAHIPAPVSGKILAINEALLHSPGILKTSPFESGWVCSVEPLNLAADLQTMKIGPDTTSWYEAEVDTYMQLLKDHAKPHTPPAGATSETELWQAVVKKFLQT